MKNVLPILLLAMALFLSSCAKDDFIPTVGVCPVLLTTNPENNATNVSVDQVITATFNTTMNPVTINSTSFILQGPSAVSGIVSYSGVTATFTPSLNLEPFTTYTATITTAVMEIRGNALQTNYVWSFTTGAPGIHLNSTERFGILAGSGISSSGLSEIHNLDVGVSPGLRSSITGFPPAVVFNGVVYASNDLIPSGIPAMLVLAQQDLTAAYLFAQNATFNPQHVLAGDVGGVILTKGIYTSLASLSIQSGSLTLDAQGDPNAFWIFQVGSDFTSVGGNGGNIVLTGGAKAQNVFWQVSNNATIGNSTSFAGNILAQNNILMNPGATIDGRLLSRNGAVILSNTNIITKP